MFRHLGVMITELHTSKSVAFASKELPAAEIFLSGISMFQPPYSETASPRTQVFGKLDLGTNITASPPKKRKKIICKALKQPARAMYLLHLKFFNFIIFHLK